MCFGRKGGSPRSAQLPGVFVGQGSAAGCVADQSGSAGLHPTPPTSPASHHSESTAFLAEETITTCSACIRLCTNSIASLEQCTPELRHIEQIAVLTMRTQRRMNAFLVLCKAPIIANILANHPRRNRNPVWSYCLPPCTLTREFSSTNHCFEHPCKQSSSFGLSMNW